MDQDLEWITQRAKKLKVLKILAAVFILFSLAGLFDIVTEQLIGGVDVGYISIFLITVAGTLGAYISSLSRIWIVWLLLGLYFYSKARVIEKIDQPGFDQKTDRDIRQLRWIKYGLIAVVGFLAVVLGLVAFGTSSPNTNCPVSLVGGDGERNYLPLGTIYALTDDPDRHYHIVEYTIHATSDQLNKMVCFATEAEAEEAGYTKAEVLSSQSVLTQEQVAELYEELKALPRDEANAIVETLDNDTYQELRKLRDGST